MSITATSFPFPYRPFFQAVVAPAKIVYGLFIRAIGYLLHSFGAIDWARDIKRYGQKMEGSASAVLVGLWAYGTRFLVSSNNYQFSCRGSCYWFIDEHLCHPEKPLSEIARFFEDEAPEVAVRIYQKHIPQSLREEKIFGVEVIESWPEMPDLEPGVYNFVLGFSEDTHHPRNAHCFVLIKEKENSFLFDPNTGLSEWLSSDWEPLLTRIASDIRTNSGGYFTLLGYRYERR